MNVCMGLEYYKIKIMSKNQRHWLTNANSQSRLSLLFPQMFFAFNESHNILIN